MSQAVGDKATSLKNSLDEGIPALLAETAISLGAYATGFTPGPGGLFPIISAALTVVSDGFTILGFAQNIILTTEVLGYFVPLFNYSFTVNSPNGSPLYQLQSKLTPISWSLQKIALGQVLLPWKPFTLPNDVKAASQFVTDLATAISTHNPVLFNQAANEQDAFIGNNLKNYADSASIEVEQKPLTAIPPFSDNLLSALNVPARVQNLNADLGLVTSMQSQIAAFVAIANAGGAAALQNGQDILNQLVSTCGALIAQDLGDPTSLAGAPSANDGGLIPYLRTTVDNDLMMLETQLKQFEPYDPADFINLEQSTQAMIDFIGSGTSGGPLSDDLANIESVLFEIGVVGENQPTDLATMAADLAGNSPVSSTNGNIQVPPLSQSFATLQTLENQLSTDVDNFDQARMTLQSALDQIQQRLHKGDVVLYAHTYLAAAANGQAAPTSPAPVLSASDPRVTALLTTAEQQWAPAIGGQAMPTITLLVEPLPAAILGESEVSAWDAEGRPTAAIILLSPDAAGQGWFVDPTPGDSKEFTQSLGTGASAAAPGSAAYGQYDLLTALEHELGHILAFDPSNAAYQSHLQTINGSQFFVGQGFSVQVDPGGELDPAVYPDDVMAASLAPGERKLPAALELEVVSTLWGTSPSPSGQSTNSIPSNTGTAVVDHAVATIGTTAPAAISNPGAASVPVRKTSVKGKKAVHGKTAPAKIHPTHSKVGVGHKKAEPRVLTKPDAKKTSTAKTAHVPNGGLAIQLSSRGAIVKKTRHEPKA